MTQKITPRPSNVLPAENETPTPKDMRERVKAMTSAELAKTISDMNDAQEMPEMFQNKETQDEVERRLLELDATTQTKDQWLKLRGAIGTKGGIASAAEEAFAKQVKEKGGLRYHLGKAILAVLAFFGFKKAKDLQESLEGKGMLRTAVEGAQEHPMFTAFLAAIGVTAGTEAYEYLNQNRDVIETGIKKEMEVSGEDIDTFAERAKKIVIGAKDLGLKGLVVGMTKLLRGTYDEETGVVTLPFGTINPPFMMAYAAGVRRRGDAPALGFFSKFLVEDKLKSIVRQANVATNAAAKAMPHKLALAQEALDYMKKGVIPGGASKESMKFERILMTLQDDLDLKDAQKLKDGETLKKIEAVDQAQRSPDAAKKRLEILEQELADFDKNNKPDFDRAKKDVMLEMKQADTALKNGNYDDAQHLKQKTTETVQKRVQEYQDLAVKEKFALGNQLTQTMNGLAAAGGGLAVRGGQMLDKSGGMGGTSGLLEKGTNFMEKAGCKLGKSKIGRIFVAGVAVKSLTPVALELAGSMRSGPEGEAAKKAAMTDMAEAGLGFVPGVGEVLDLKTAIMGTDLNGREVSTNQRIVAGAMGALGTVSIGLGFFTGGLSIGAFRLFRGAVGTAKVVGRIAKGADAVDTSIDIVRAAQNQADVLKGLSKVSDAQKAAITAKKYVDNTQRLAQIATYGYMGVDLYESVAWAYDNTEEFISDTTDKVVQGIDIAKNFANERLPSNNEPAVS